MWSSAEEMEILMADVGAAMRQRHQSEGWKLAMQTALELIDKMIRWDRNPYSVHETYEMAFEIAAETPLGTPVDEIFQLWIIEREKLGC